MTMHYSICRLFVTGTLVAAAAGCATQHQTTPYPYSAQEREDNARRTTLAEVVTCENDLSRAAFDELMVGLKAHRAIHEVNSTQSGHKPNIDYLFPRGMTLFGLPVVGISARTEVIPAGPYQHAYTAYSVRFADTVSGNEVRRRLDLRDENLRGHGMASKRAGLVGQHDLIVRTESGQEYLTCGYQVRTFIRLIKDVS